MWMRGSSGAAPDLTLRTGAALVGVDPEALWVDCCAAANEDLPYDSVTAAVLGTGHTDNRIWNIVANAIDVRVMAQGFSPLFSSRPVIDLG